MRKIKKSKAKKNLSTSKTSKPIAKKKKKAARAKPTRAASTRSASATLAVPASLKANLATRAKAAGMSNWKAFANSLLNPTVAA